MGGASLIRVLAVLLGMALSAAAQAQAPAVRLSAGSLSFSATPVSTLSPQQVVTLTNTGRRPLALQTIAFTGPNANSFLLHGGSSIETLGPGTSLTLGVIFYPAAIGSLSASLTIS